MKPSIENQHISIFSDASDDPKTKLGVGGYLVLSKKGPLDVNLANESDIHIKIFEKTHNTRLELKTIIWAINSLKRKPSFSNPIRVYTDCQTAINLLTRRNHLETNNYMSKASKQKLKNADLYQEFFEIYDELKPELVWVKGHVSKKYRNTVDHIFSIVDKTVRKKLRSYIRRFKTKGPA